MCDHVSLQHGGGGNNMGDEDENSMLKVICSQRDRFRQRLRETEEVSASCLFQNLIILPVIFRSRYRELLNTVQVFFRLEVWRSKALIMKWPSIQGSFYHTTVAKLVIMKCLCCPQVFSTLVVYDNIWLTDLVCDDYPYDHLEVII